MNTLDLGGLKIALKTWYSKELLDKDEIPGLGYSPEQLFFIGFAQVSKIYLLLVELSKQPTLYKYFFSFQTFCASYTEEQFNQEVSHGFTTPVPFRVNAIVESFDEFQNAWNCSKHIHQSHVCHLW